MLHKTLDSTLSIELASRPSFLLFLSKNHTVCFARRQVSQKVGPRKNSLGTSTWILWAIIWKHVPFPDCLQYLYCSSLYAGPLCLPFDRGQAAKVLNSDLNLFKIFLFAFLKGNSKRFFSLFIKTFSLEALQVRSF